ncbi:MAG: FAD-dependent oxidoreductase [Pseudomonadota bacterium]
MSAAFPNIFKPLNIRGKALNARVNFGAHTANMAEAGLPGERHLGYYLERSLGGVGMIVVEPMPVHETAVLTRGNFRHSDDAVIPAFRRITDACHEQGTVMIHQLYHVGQHGDFDLSFAPSWSPSGLPSYHDSDGSHAMSEAEILETIEAFARAAERAQKSGFDGIEIFAAYHALPDQFWTPWSNRRDDRWGGSLENRVRFSAEICKAIRARTGDDFIIGMAISMQPEIEVSLSVEAMQEIIAWHDERALIDYVTCGTGSYFDFYALIPTFPYPDKLGPPFAEALKAVVKHARVQSESHIRTPENADYVIGSGQADMVSIVRGQIADPHLVTNAREGRADDVRPCLSCNQMCWGRRHRDYWISCLVNPSSGREFEWGGDRFAPSGQPRKVLVVGGGMAGLEAARVSAERGHQVTLAEASDKLGGQFRLAGLQPRRTQILDLLDWYERQLQKLQVQVRYNSYLDASEIEAFGADEVIFATGSLPDGQAFQRALPQHDALPGLENGNVHSVEEVMGREARPGQRVIVLDDGGNWRGAGTAWHLADAGHHVTVVTMLAVVGKELERTAADGPMRRRLREKGVQFRTEAAITHWHGDGATVIDLLNGKEDHIPADTLVTATPNVANTMVQDEIDLAALNAHHAGDCVAPRTAIMAIYEGRKLGLGL